MAINPYSTRTLTRVVNALADTDQIPPTFLRDMFFAGWDRAFSEYIDIDVITQKRHLSQFVSPERKPRLVEKNGFTMKSVKFPYISEMTAVSAQEAAEFRDRGEGIYDQTGLAARAEKILNRELVQMIARLTRREEWMAAMLLQDGSHEIKGPGIDAEIDFGMSTAHKTDLTGTDLWTDTDNSDPLANIRTWDRLIMGDSGHGANVLVLGYEAEEAFINHPKVQDFFNNRRMIAGSMEFRVEGTPEEKKRRVISYVGNYRGIEIYAYYAKYYNVATTQDEYLLASDHIILGSTDAITDRLYGTIKDFKAGMTNERYFSKSWEEEKPSRRLISIDSAPLLCMWQPDAYVSLAVV